MTKKNYNWENGAKLEDHTRKKHSILTEYFRQYLLTRCQVPQREKFRLAIVDGFSGAGLYECGSYGSPLIFIDVLTKTANEISLYRLNEGMRPIYFECLIILNDDDSNVIKQLKNNVTPLLLKANNTNQNLRIEVEYLSEPFERKYLQIKQRLISAKCSNVIFNLDQCGYSLVTSTIIRDIIASWRSAEILLTFMIDSMLAYLSPNKNTKGASLEPKLKEKVDALRDEDNLKIGKKQWLGKAEKIVFEHLKDCAPFVSPFSINNPEGWRYWLMHFASSYRARQVYNDILHQDGNAQAHFGRAGLKMLSYDPDHEGQLYLFDSNSRTLAKKELYDDIPKLIAESGDTLGVEDFYKVAYSETPAHSDDIHEMMIENPDVEIITESGGKRRKPNTIKIGDTLKLKSQTSMFFMFSN